MTSIRSLPGPALPPPPPPFVPAARSDARAHGLFTRTVVLPGVSPILLRPTRSSDADAIGALFAGLSAHDRGARFHAGIGRVGDAALRRLARSQPREHAGYVAVVRRDGADRLVAEAHLAVEGRDATTASFALTVAPDWRRRGIGRECIRALTDVAAGWGVANLQGCVRHGNAAMLGLARRCGFALGADPAGGDLRVVLATPAARAAERASAPMATLASDATPAVQARLPDAASTHRARVAVVIGSGGVRSIAAVGVVDALADAGVSVDLIVGCSSGAVFGAPLAMGCSSEQTLAMATRLWTPELTASRRWRAYPQLIAPRLARFGDDFALRESRPIARRLQDAFGDRTIESLPIELRVAATDARSGKPVVLSRGRLADALLASMALPFIFPSVVVEGRRLVDGVVSDPLPVAAAHDADVIVAVGFEGVMPRRIDRASRLAAQASTTLINNLLQARLDAARGRGCAIVRVDPVIGRHVGLWQVDAMPSLFEAGRRAAVHELPRIRAMLDDARPRS